MQVTCALLPARGAADPIAMPKFGISSMNGPAISPRGSLEGAAAWAPASLDPARGFEITGEIVQGMFHVKMA